MHSEFNQPNPPNRFVVKDADIPTSVALPAERAAKFREAATTMAKMNHVGQGTRGIVYALLAVQATIEELSDSLGR